MIKWKVNYISGKRHKVGFNFSDWIWRDQEETKIILNIYLGL